MQYLVSVLFDGEARATPSEMEAIDAFNARLVAAGQRVFAGGLASPAASTVIDNRDGVGLINHAPLVEMEEWVAGLWILEAPDLDTALQLAAEGSKACNRKVEVRPFLGF